MVEERGENKVCADVEVVAALALTNQQRREKLRLNLNRG